MTIDSEQFGLLNSLKTAIVLLDEAHSIVFINSAGEEFLHSSLNQLRHKPVQSLFENKQLIQDCLQRIASNNGSIIIKEVAIKPVNHRRQIVTCTFNHVTRTENSEVVSTSIELLNQGQFSIITDKGINEQAEAQSSQKLIQGMAHEIKNPLGGIRGASQLLSGNLSSREDKDYINIILHETDRLVDLVDRMSGYIKDKRMLPLNIHRVLEHIYKLLNADKPDNVMFKRDYDPSLPEITGSESSLIQAFINLALNALQAVGETGVIIFRSRLVFGTVIQNEQFRQVIKIDIQDDGSGIDDSIRETLFEPLISSKPLGTGLGLSISNEIITAHKGKIEFSSQPGCTIFSIFLPVQEIKP